jgi:hypothetical protein
VWSDAELQALTTGERADLAYRLAALADPVFRDTAEVRRRRSRRFVNLLVLCCLVLTPWIGILALTLPVHYVASHWRGAWVGLDLALLIGLATTAWAGWRRRHIVILSTLVTATLLATDAWFDVLTSSTQGASLLSLADAVLIELPLAVLLFRVGVGLLRVTIQESRRLAGIEDSTTPFWRTKLFTLGNDPTRLGLPGQGGPRGRVPPAGWAAGGQGGAPQPPQPAFTRQWGACPLRRSRPPTGGVGSSWPCCA